MFADYKRSVLAEYEKKKASGALSFNLTHITPANLKSECMAVCEARFERKDEKLLQAFFGQRADATAYRQAIKNGGADRFRPLVTFLRKKSIGTDEKNIELLAWLIDFEPRPYQAGQIYTAAETAKPPFTESRGDDISGGNPVKKNGEIKDIRREKIFILLIALALAGGIIYYVVRQRPPVTAAAGHRPAGPDRCMYWTGDHYQPISCSQKLGDTAIIALDSIRLAHFRKITQPDTLTRSSVKKVWYVKINGQVEFFTSAGFHPVHTERRLLPMTVYILNKYAGTIKSKN